MSRSVPLEERRKALEDQFFAKQNQKLAAELRAKHEHDEQRGVLSAASGIRDEAVLDSLLEAGIGGGTVAALSLVPLVAVAWANGNVTKEERQAVLRAAHEAGVESGSDAHSLLDGWLDTRPASTLLETWLAYASALSDVLDDAQCDALRTQLVDRARAVAQAAGGFLGIGSISAREQSVLEQLEDAL